MNDKFLDVKVEKLTLKCEFGQSTRDIWIELSLSFCQVCVYKKSKSRDLSQRELPRWINSLKAHCHHLHCVSKKVVSKLDAPWYCTFHRESLRHQRICQWACSASCRRGRCPLAGFISSSKCQPLVIVWLLMMFYVKGSCLIRSYYN